MNKKQSFGQSFNDCCKLCRYKKLTFEFNYLGRLQEQNDGWIVGQCGSRHAPYTQCKSFCYAAKKIPTALLVKQLLTEKDMVAIHQLRTMLLLKGVLDGCNE